MLWSLIDITHQKSICDATAQLDTSWMETVMLDWKETWWNSHHGSSRCFRTCILVKGFFKRNILLVPPYFTLPRCGTDWHSLFLILKRH